MLNTPINKWYYRRERKLLRLNEPMRLTDQLDEPKGIIDNALTVGWCVLLAGLMLMASCMAARPVHAYIDRPALCSEYPYIENTKISNKVIGALMKLTEQERKMIFFDGVGVRIRAKSINEFCNPSTENYTNIRIVDAIYLAEGGTKTKYPYGIRSIRCDTVAECRQICLNSVRNARKRWIKAGRPEDFITHMGRRYSPPKTNPNWVRLVKYFLKSTA